MNSAAGLKQGSAVLRAFEGPLFLAVKPVAEAKEKVETRLSRP